MPKKRPADKAAELAAYLWAALGYLAKKRGARDLLTVGAKTRVDVTIEGKVGRSRISERIVGHVALSPDQMTASSAAAPVDHVAALLLEQFSDSDKFAVMAEIVATKEKTGRLGDVTEEQLTEARAFLARLRSTTQKPKAGALTFAAETK